MDSCGEISEDMKESGLFFSVPFSIDIEGHHFTDDESFDMKRFLRLVMESPTVAKSACPSPGKFQKAFGEEAERVYVVTISAQLSGAYNSACLAMNMEEEDHPDRKVHVFNSKSASVGETLIARKIWECEKEGFSFDHTVEAVEEYIESQVTWFVLETLDTLRKNGRLSNLKAALATALKIKPICSSTPDGAIQQAGQARGINKALVRMVDMAAEAAEHTEKKEIAVCHVDCPERGLMVLDALKEKVPARNYLLLPASGLTCTYANDGGIVVVI